MRLLNPQILVHILVLESHHVLILCPMFVNKEDFIFKRTSLHEDF